MMNDEQSKRLSEAADTLVQAWEALDEAREALGDRRFESDQERERMVAAQQMASRLDNAGKRIEDALRKGAIAAAAAGRTGAWPRYQESIVAAREGRQTGKSAQEADGVANKRARGQEAWERLNEAAEGAATLVFLE
ncbi:MAG TPA: hypothetical protein VFY90_02235 [Tepidiformaceae bacterium]|nr:hypothetical protein [Tepidiformaceae bacterium]